MNDKRPAPHELWRQAAGNLDRYLELMREYGHIVEGESEALPCGWPEMKISGR